MDSGLGTLRCLYEKQSDILMRPRMTSGRTQHGTHSGQEDSKVHARRPTPHSLHMMPRLSASCFWASSDHLEQPSPWTLVL